ncbi:MAG: VTT domain-containing protein [Candidatus Uhrbacteria bacterium]
MKLERSHWLKIWVLVAYVIVIVGVYVAMNIAGVHFNQLPEVMRQLISHAGVFGPFLLILFYIISTIIPFPTAALAALGGALFGPWLGATLVVIGVNTAACISFWMARYLGRHFVSENERGWVKKYDDTLSSQGFYAVLAMRVLFFPFDVVSIGCGLTRMSYREYALGTFLGSLPTAISFVVLGQSFDSPGAWILFAVLMIGTVIAGVLIHRSDWAKKHLS